MQCFPGWLLRFFATVKLAGEIRRRAREREVEFSLLPHLSSEPLRQPEITTARGLIASSQAWGSKERGLPTARLSCAIATTGPDCGASGLAPLSLPRGCRLRLGPPPAGAELRCPVTSGGSGSQARTESPIPALSEVGALR